MSLELPKIRVFPEVELSVILSVDALYAIDKSESASVIFLKMLANESVVSTVIMESLIVNVPLVAFTPNPLLAMYVEPFSSLVTLLLNVPDNDVAPTEASASNVNFAPFLKTTTSPSLSAVVNASTVKLVAPSEAAPFAVSQSICRPASEPPFCSAVVAR